MAMIRVDYDVIIVGGGIYGSGAAQAVAANGHKVLLMEQNEIASGTSSQSTKLIHGGLRYLEQLNMKLVYEALSERERLLQNAAELVSREWFYIPIYKHSKRPAWLVAIGLFLYFVLSGGRSHFKNVPKTEWASVLPGLNTKDLKAVLAYEDAATDDRMLTKAVAISAQSMGCEVREHTRMSQAVYDGARWNVTIDSGEKITCNVLINATGAWANRVSAHVRPKPPAVNVQLVQGTHLVLDRECPSYIYTESTDGRVMFFRPWQGKVLVGTTETVYTGDPAEREPTASEIKDILDTYNFYFPDTPCTEKDIIDTFCGLRVLPVGKSDEAFAVKRETVILCNNNAKPNYIVIYGGKLTTYRKESERVARYVQRAFSEVGNRSTKEMKLS